MKISNPAGAPHKLMVHLQHLDEEGKQHTVFARILRPGEEIEVTPMDVRSGVFIGPVVKCDNSTGAA